MDKDYEGKGLRVDSNGFLEYFDPGDEADMQQAKEMFVHEEIGTARYNEEALAKITIEHLGDILPDLPCESSSTPTDDYLRLRCSEDGFTRRIMPPMESCGSSTCCSSYSGPVTVANTTGAVDWSTCTLAGPGQTLDISQHPFNITFHGDVGEIGKLTYNEDKKQLEFEGDADYSAVLFFEHIKDELERYLNEREDQ